MNQIWSRKKVFSQLLISLIVFIISKFLILMVQIQLDHNYLDITTWVRWDAAHYLGIAKNGYEFFSCAGHFGYPLDAKEFCGNTGWFPAYSFLIRFVSAFVGSYEYSAVLLSNLFYFFSLYLMLRISNKYDFSLHTFAFLLVAAFFFGFIYYHAVFPISMIICISLLSIHYFLKRQIWIAALFAMLVSFTYASGFLLTTTLVLLHLFEKKTSFKKNLLFAGLTGLIGGLGLIACFLIFELKFNDWQAFFKVQAKYEHHLQNPILNLADYFSVFNRDELLSDGNIILSQSLLVIATYLLALIVYLRKGKKRTRLHSTILLYASLFLVFPWIVGGELSMYRSEALLLPIVLIFKDFKTDYLTSLLGVLLFIGVPMSMLFFKNVLI